ncbi:MAG: DUF1989 domain-containing protein [Pseudomonadota bacterium]
MFGSSVTEAGFLETPAAARVRYQRNPPGLRSRRDVEAGDIALQRVQRGDLIAITAVDGGAPVFLTAIPDHAEAYTASALLEGLVDHRPVDLLGRCDDREITERLAARNATSDNLGYTQLFDQTTAPATQFIARAHADGILAIAMPQPVDFLSSGGGGRIDVTVQAAGGTETYALPDPLGPIVDEWRIERGTAHAYEVARGQFIQILDVEGQQCSDFMAMRADALEHGIERYIDSTVSRTMARAAYPQPGLLDKLFDADMRPLLALRQDTVGRHDTFALACTALGYEERGFPGHVNCSDNISDAYAPFGIARRPAWPAINLFFNSWIDHNAQIATDEAWSQPGDHVVFEALSDLVCVSTACPDDVDPINGWNPTDIHVRIYEDTANVSPAVGWRATPDDATRMTRPSAFHTRTSALTTRFAPARDVWLASAYDASGVEEEYWACRERATLQDMSSLLIYDVIGPDAQTLLQRAMTRDVSRLARHRATYTLICDRRGTVIDDGTLFRLEPSVFRWCCGSEHSALHLRELADDLGLQVHIRSLSERIANVALQGPRARDILRGLVFTQPTQPSLDNLRWFGFTIARLHDRDGPMFMLSRTGFTGELGYELFCDTSDAEKIWDALMEAGQPHGLIPMGNDALAILRIEAGLMAAGAEFTPDVDAFEAGLGFAVDLKKEGFVGREALVRNAEAPRRKLVGLQFAGDEVPSHGDHVYEGRDVCGTITSATYSPSLGSAIAMARIAVENAELDTILEVGQLDGHQKRLPARVVRVPFIDPGRKRPRA